VIENGVYAAKRMNSTYIPVRKIFKPPSLYCRGRLTTSKDGLKKTGFNIFKKNTKRIVEAKTTLKLETIRTVNRSQYAKTRAKK
jgi:hypothetical protein